MSYAISLSFAELIFVTAEALREGGFPGAQVWREGGCVWNGRPAGARAVLRCGSVSLSSFVRLRFLVEKFGARSLVFAKLLVQGNGARGGVRLVGGRGFDVPLESGNLV